MKLEQTEGELRSLSKEFQGLRTSLAQRDTSVLQLQNTITTLTQKLTIAHRKEVSTSSGNERIMYFRFISRICVVCKVICRYRYLANICSLVNLWSDGERGNAEGDAEPTGASQCK